MSNKSLDVDHEIKQLRKIQPHWNQLDNEKENKVRISIYILLMMRCDNAWNGTSVEPNIFLCKKVFKFIYAYMTILSRTVRFNRQDMHRNIILSNTQVDFYIKNID